MTRPAKTVWLFGIYLLLEGLFLMFAPSNLLTMIGLPDPESVWRVVVGFAVAVLGYYYIRNARENLIPFFGFTVQVRALQLVFFVGLFLFSQGTLTLVLFSFVEFVAGMWTWRALRAAST